MAVSTGASSTRGAGWGVFGAGVVFGLGAGVGVAFGFGDGVSGGVLITCRAGAFGVGVFFFLPDIFLPRSATHYKIGA